MLHFIFLKQQTDAHCQAAYYGVFTLNHRSCIERYAVNINAMNARLMLHLRVQFGRLQQRF